MKTRSSGLQLCLQRFAELSEAALALNNPSRERTDAILTFCRSFVPVGCSEDDIDHFAGNLSSDEVDSIKHLFGIFIEFIV